MKAWQLERLGGELRFNSVRTPEPRPGSALVRIEASALMSYLKAYVEGKLPVYNPPPGPFTIGTNGVGVVEAVGRDVWHLKPGQRVVLSSHFVAAESTLAALHSLHRGGRLVLMGSMTTDLPIPYTTVMLNSWEIIGQFMYPAGAYRRLLDLLRGGLLDIRAIRPRVYPLSDLPEAMEAAATAGNLECIVMQP